MYFVYILTNHHRSVFYTGVTNNLKRRLSEHERDKGITNSFTSRYYCYKLIHYEEFQYIEDAIKREKEIKKLSRQNKIDLVKTRNPNLHFLKI